VKRLAFVPILLALLLTFTASADLQSDAKALSALIDPAKLATLKERGANPRIQKAVAILESSRRDGNKVTKVAAEAVKLAGYRKSLAVLTQNALVRNHDTADKLGVLNTKGLADMRRGQAPTIRKGPYKGDELSVDHIVPRAVAPELDNVIANLELLPFKLNAAKNDKMGDRQRDLAKKLCSAGLLSKKRLREITERKK